MDDPGMREQVLACAQAAGFNDIVSGDRWTSDHAPRFGLDGKIIAKRHRDAWVDFMARRVARMFGMFRRTIRELSPAARFSVYKGDGRA